MIAVAVLGLIMSQMFLVLSTQKRAYVGTTRTLDVQESARLVTDLIAFDVRMAGLMVPRSAGVSSTDGGNNAPDRLCLSDPDIFQIPESVDDDPLWDSRDSRFEGSIMTQAPVNLGASWELTLNSLDVDGAGAANDYQSDRGIILSDSVTNKTFCSRIVSVNTVTRKVTIAHNPGAVVPIGAAVVPAIVYEVAVTPGLGGALDTLSLRRNDTPLSTVIEDLQVEYWVDRGPPDCDGVMDANEFPVSDLNAAAPAPILTRDLDRVRLVRVSVVARAEIEDDAAGAQVDRHKRPAVANRLEGAADGFRRRRFSTSVMPRNVLARPTTDPANCAFVP